MTALESTLHACRGAPSKADRDRARARLKHPTATLADVAAAIAVLQRSTDWADVVLARELDRASQQG